MAERRATGPARGEGGSAATSARRRSLAPRAQRQGRAETSHVALTIVLLQFHVTPDALVSEVQQLAGRKNLTESIILALREWADLQRIRELNDRVEKRPLVFRKGFSAAAVRELNRRVP